MTTDKLYSEACRLLTESGIEAASEECSLLLEGILGITRRDMLLCPDREVSDEEYREILNCITRRTQGEPLQYIMGYWEFFSRKFFVGTGVLIPRDDTEVVLRCTLPYLDRIYKENKCIKILDLCSGSGILAITLKSLYPESEVTAVEISDDALPYLRKNALHNAADINIIHGDIFIVSDSFEDGYFDLIISNPPYVRSAEMEVLQREVQHEPALALAGGEDGCDFYRRIIPLYTKKLRRGGMLAFEYDSTQAQLIRRLMADAGYRDITVFDDLGGVHRAINGTVQSI